MTRRSPLPIAVLFAASACTPVRPVTSAVAPAKAVVATAAPRELAVMDAPTVDAAATPREPVLQALSARVATLLSLGGGCRAYGAVLEGAIATGRLEVRPYMWRIGNQLASAQALSSGAITVAREVDPLNVGVRTIPEVVHSAEHEAAHVAFAIPSGSAYNEDAVNRRVGECRAAP